MLKKFLFISIISIVKVFCSELFVASLSDNEKTYSDLNEKQKNNITAIKAMYQEHIDKQDTYIKENQKYHQTINTVILSEICRAFVDINPYEISGRYYQNSFIVEFLQSEGFLKPENFTRAHFNYLLLMNVLKFMRESKDETFSDNTIDTVVEKIKSAYKNDDSVYDYSSNICQSKLKLAAYDIKQYFKELELYDFIKNIKQGNYKVDSHYADTYEIVARGMQNVGGTCYFNSAIQLLVTSKEFVSLVNFLAKDPRNKASGYLKELFNKFRKHEKKEESKTTNTAIPMDPNDIKKFFKYLRFKPTDRNGATTKSIGNQSASELIIKILEAISEEDTRKYEHEFDDLRKQFNVAQNDITQYITTEYGKSIPKKTCTKNEEEKFDKFKRDLAENDNKYKSLIKLRDLLLDKKIRIQLNTLKRTAYYNTLGCYTNSTLTCIKCRVLTETNELSTQIQLEQPKEALTNPSSAYNTYSFKKCFSYFMGQEGNNFDKGLKNYGTKIEIDHPCTECKSDKREYNIKRQFGDVLQITLKTNIGEQSANIEDIPDTIIINDTRYELIGFTSGGLGHWKCYAIREGKLWKLNDSSAKIANGNDEEIGKRHARDILYMVKK